MGRASWARWAHEVFTWLVLLAIPASHDVYGWRGPALITLFVSPTTCVLDWLVSNTFQSNLQRLNKFGYSTRQVVFVMGYNLVTSNALMVAVKAVYCPDALGAIRQLDCLKVLKMAAAVVVSLGLTEVAFTPGHSYLHNTQRGARLHLMHHCCRPSSWSANLIFHPMDMIIEFGAPILTLVAAYHVVWRSVLDDEAGLSLLASVTTLHLWYKRPRRRATPHCQRSYRGCSDQA
ncbi:hypothetical protein M885DRAFT_199514 [Pelagophyceae sp. CCMP2097]|nr:hypothetical protein M885DRAFT_199514 [Pelagophyceae sp. CCMP2097]